MFRRRVRRRTGENTSPPPPQPTLRARSTSELAMDIQHSRSGGPYNQGLSVSHDSVFTPDGAEHHHHHHAHATPPSLTIATRGVNMAELKAALRQRRGDDSGSGDDDPGLPRSPPTSPTTLDVLTHGLKGSSRATQSSCSDGSLLSMGSSENDEDSLGAASHHSSRASLLEGRHQVVEEAKKIETSKTDTANEEEQENQNKDEEKEEEEEGKKKKRKKKKELRRRRGDPTRFTFVSDAIIVGREPVIDVEGTNGKEEEEEEEEEEEDHEPVAGAVRLSHQAALHKIAVRPRRTHGAPRSRRATQIGGQISLPDVIEEANSRHPSGPRPSSTPQHPAAATPAPAPPTPVPSTQVTPEDDVSMEESPAVREPQNSPDTATPERKEERREDQPLFQRLFGSTSKRAGRRHSRGSGEESRENSVSPLRRGTEQRASKDRRHETSSPRFLIGSSKPRQDGHALPPSGRPRDPSKERGSREVPQSPEDVQGGGVAASAWPQGVRKAKSFREEQAPVHREALRRKVSSHATADEQSTTPTKASRLSSSLESIDGDDTRKPTQRSTPTATPPTVTTASPQRSSTESLTTTPLPGVFIRPYPQPGHPRGPPHPSSADTSSGPFSLDSSLNQQPREVEDQMRKASSVDQMTVTETTTTTTHHREHHTRETLTKEQVTKEQLAKEHAAREHIIEQHIKEQHMKEQLNKEQHIREEHTKHTTTTKTCEAKQAAMAAAKQSLLDTLVESIKPDRKTETPKATPRRSLSQTQPQVLPKEEPPPGTPQQEPEGEQTPPRRPLRREASVKRLPAPMNDSESVAVPEFMRIQLNRVESKGQSVIYDTEQEKGGRKEEEDVPRKDTGSMDIPKDTPTEPDLNPLKKDMAVKDAPTPAAAKDVTRKASMQGSRPLLKDTRDVSPSGVIDGEGNTETPEQERVQLRRPVVTDRTPTAERSAAAATTTPITSRDQPELFKVFARRSFKIKDSDKELFETSIEDTGVEASSEVSEMVVSSVRPSSTSPRPPVNTSPATDAQKIGINAISYNRKSVGNPALSFMPPPVSSANEQVNRPQTTATTPKTPPTTASTTKSPQTTASTSKSPQPSTDSSATPPTVYSKILSNRMSGSEVSSGNESEGSVSSPVPIRAPVNQQTKPAMAARPGSAIIWPPRPQASQEDTAPPQPTTAPQDTPHRKSLGSVDTKEASQDGIEVEVSPLDISAARRRFMSASYPPDRPGTSPALGTSPPALTPSPVTPSPSPPAPTPSPPAPTHPPISSNILSRVGSISTTNPATPSFTVTVRTQPPADTPAPSTAPSAPPTGGSPGEQGKGDAGQGQQTAEDWRVLVRQRREGRLKHTKTPDSEEIIIETRPPVSRNSKVLEMASNFQKLQVA
ncbi:serine/arginine repetitive matrix protein 2-like isoform X3 [Portunus trituberculatus]|uniref:serine/arginine repetitive matrix protein 2-like isoform X3 n=1 Tax=Portunus trituberculatus TaxID=210409 RepID=UPI001E1D19BE|nr:serine/arginine repetitive matrix protein 2-like isoform X3 [Portunus trituberculatus]